MTFHFAFWGNWQEAFTNEGNQREFLFAIGQRFGGQKLKQLGKYEIIRELGRGAMGVVFKARDPVIGRLIALKTISTSLAENQDLLERFYREARAAGSLQHPNVVTIYDMGEADGVPFIAMEYLEGETLEQLIARRPFSPLAQKLGYFVQTCRALDYAHRRGIVHRDIKPGNIMVTMEGIVKVVDFGIARIVETSKTQTGTLLGTLGYMSPEQLRGKHADERSDIWSAGVVLYELLSYERPFSGENHAALLLSILRDAPAPICARARDCPPEIAMIIEKALRKEEGARYQSMEELLLAVEPLWTSLQRETVRRMIDQSREFIQAGKLQEARELLRQSLQIDTSSLTAVALLEEVTARLDGSGGRTKLREFVAKGESLVAEGLFLDARKEAQAALELNPYDSAVRRLLEEIELQEERIRRVLGEITAPVPADSAKEYAFQAAGNPVAHLSRPEGSIRDSATLRLHSPGEELTRAVGVGPARGPSKAVAQAGRPAARAARQPSLPDLAVALPGVSQKSKRSRGPVYTLVALVVVLGIGLGVLRRLKTARPAVETTASAPSSVPTPAPAPLAAPSKPASLEDQQRQLVDLAHQAADRNDYAAALDRLDQAEKLNGPLNPLLKDLRKEFTAEEHNVEIQRIAKREGVLWKQAINDMNSDRLDPAVQSFNKILALPPGGRRRADAQRYLDQVIPARQQGDQLWTQAQQVWESNQPGRPRQVVKLLDQIIVAGGPHQQEAQQWRDSLMEKFSQRAARNHPGQFAGNQDRVRARFNALVKQFNLAVQQGDEAGRQLLLDLRPQFRAIARGGGPFAPNALDYANNLIPDAVKQIENRTVQH